MFENWVLEPHTVMQNFEKESLWQGSSLTLDIEVNVNSMNYSSILHIDKIRHKVFQSYFVL